MNLGDLISEYRDQMVDNAIPPRVSDARLTRLANVAVIEAVRRAHLIIDSTTQEICVIPFTTNPVLDLDFRVIQIREAIIDGQTLDLKMIRVGEIQGLIPAWRTATPNVPRFWISDYGSNKIRLWPPPQVAGTVLLSVYREPLCAMVWPGDEPEIPDRFRFPLVYWMIHLVRLGDDSEDYDPVRAATAAQKFSAEFGSAVSARSEKWTSEQGAGFPDSLA